MSRARRAQERPRQTNPGGFSLLEILVAFVIAGLAVATVVRATSGAIDTASAAASYDEAVTLAQSHLAMAEALPLVESDRQGDDAGGFHWRIAIAASAQAHLAARFPAGSVTLYRVVVTMSWQDGGHARAVQLSSARLGPIA